MARSFNGTSDYMVTSANLDNSGTNVLSLSFWINWTTNGTGFDLAFESTTNFNNFTTGFFISPDDPTSALSVTLKGDVGNSNNLIGPLTEATWTHLLVVLNKGLSSQECRVYKNSVLQAEGGASDSNNTNNFGDDPLYFMSRAGASLFGQGYMCEVAMYPGVTLTQADATALFRGAAPSMVRPNIKPWYWPVLGRFTTENELFHGVGLTLGGSTHIAHPRMYYPE